MSTHEEWSLLPWGCWENRTEQESKKQLQNGNTCWSGCSAPHYLGLDKLQHCHPWSERAGPVEDVSKALSHLCLIYGEGQELMFAGGGKVGSIV